MLNENKYSIIKRNKLFNNIRYYLRIYNSYSTGMKKYVRDNEYNLSRIDIVFNSIITLIEEIIEFLKEIIYMNPKNAIKELFDVWHSFIICIFMIFTPRSFWISSISWYTIFFISLVIAPYKHSIRYINYGCIRNKNHCLSVDHICNVNRQPRV